MKNRAFYRTYLQSEAWRHKRRWVLFRDERQCQHCGSRTQLEVHHRHYRNLGREKLEDLITLCKTCHQQQHGKPLKDKLKKTIKRRRHYGQNKNRKRTTRHVFGSRPN
jgi:5-methylcytosine-specific restriction endonuclease McrA